MTSGDASRDLDALAEQFLARLRRGEPADVESYARAHPRLAEDIRELFPVLAVMEEVKSPVRPGGASRDVLPDRVGGYRVRREIGRGSMGRVLEAASDRGERVAIKVAHEALAGDPAFVERWRLEADIGARLSHPGLVRTFGSGTVEDTGAPYLVLELVEGQSLRSLLAEVGVVPERLARYVGARLAESLAAAHAAGVVHGDVKPENVVIRSDESVVLIDLGVARLAGGASTVDRGFAGSMLYAAPEQLAGLETGPAADLYALGAVLHELATGRHPAEPARGPSDAWPSPFLAALVASLLASAPEDRFPSAGELAVVLEQGESSAWWRGRDAAGSTAARAAPRPDREPALVGRDAERRALDEAYDAVVDGSGRVVLVEGEAGIGKTRLVDEWAASLERRPEGPRVLVAPHAPGAAGASDSLAALAGVSTSDAPAGAVVQALRRLAATAPVVVVVEDLHFAPGATRATFVALARAVASARLLVVGTTRPGGLEEWRKVAGLPQARTLRLGALDAGASQDLLARAVVAFGGDLASVPDPGAVARTTDGNPFFLVEHAREAVRCAGRGEVAPAIAATARAVVEGRLAALSAEDRDVAAAAACCGFEPDAALVAKALGRGRVAVWKAFGRLDRRHGLLREARGAFSFRHHLVAEAIYGAIDVDRRIALHAALADAIAPDDEAHVVALCEHASKGGRPETAARVLVRALRVLRSQWEFARGVRLATPLLAAEGPRRLEGAERAEALVGLAECLAAQHRYAPARRALDEAVGLADAAGGPPLRAAARRVLGQVLSGVSDHAEAGDVLREAAALSREAGDARGEAVARCDYGLAIAYLGREEESIATCLEAAEAARRCGDAATEARGLQYAASRLIKAYRFPEAEALLRRSREVTAAAGDRDGLANSLERLGYLAYRRADFEAALALHVDALAAAREVDVGLVEAGFVANVARDLYELGRLEEAAARVVEADVLARQGDRPFDRMEARSLRGQVDAALGRLAAAHEALGDARSMCEALPTRGMVGPVCHASEVLTLLGRGDEATAALDATERKLALDASVTRAWIVAFRGFVAEARGAHGDALALYDRAVSAQGGAGVRHGRWILARGRTLVRLGRRAEARAALAEAVEWGRRTGAERVAVVARAHLATLEGGDVLAARVALERHEGELHRRDRLEARMALWEATGDDAHLAAAREHLASLVEHAPPACRVAMVERVDLHRRAARAEHAGA